MSSPFLWTLPSLEAILEHSLVAKLAMGGVQILTWSRTLIVLKGVTKEALEHLPSHCPEICSQLYCHRLVLLRNLAAIFFFFFLSKHWRQDIAGFELQVQCTRNITMLCEYTLFVHYFKWCYINNATWMIQYKRCNTNDSTQMVPNNWCNAQCTRCNRNCAMQLRCWRIPSNGAKQMVQCTMQLMQCNGAVGAASSSSSRLPPNYCKPAAIAWLIAPLISPLLLNNITWEHSWALVQAR